MARDIQTKSGLTALYNEQVVSAERVKRPIDSSGKGLPVRHQGVRITTESGSQYLVHKGPNYGKSRESSQTVVTDVQHMSSKWMSTDTRGVSGHTVGDFVKAGGTNYSRWTDNCIHGANRMMHLGHK